MFSHVLNFLFPKRCHRCSAPGSALCASCTERIPFASSLPRYSYAVYDYGNATVRYAIRQLKYHRRNELAYALATAAVPHINEYISDTLQSIDTETVIFVPIPEHPRSVHTRGFNQSLLLAKWWSAHIPSTVLPLLKKIVFTLPQARLSRHARMKNLANTMQSSTLLSSIPIYIVVDDVTTTGATFTEARRALTDAGAKKIFTIALAHGYSKK